MKKYILDKKYNEFIERTLNQFGWPIKLRAESQRHTMISSSIVKSMKVKFKEKVSSNLEIELTIYEFFALLIIIKYALDALWWNEFHTVTWLDFDNQAVPFYYELIDKYFSL